MSGISFVSVSREELKRIACPTCHGPGTLEFVSDGSSAVLEGRVSDTPQAVCCDECDFSGDESLDAIQSAARTVRARASVPPTPVELVAALKAKELETLRAYEAVVQACPTCSRKHIAHSHDPKCTGCESRYGDYIDAKNARVATQRDLKQMIP